MTDPAPTTVDAVPPPPPGPGVRPPFAAAPVEGRRAWRGLALGLAGAVVLLCAGVGVVTFLGLVVTGVEALNERAHRAVGDYLEAQMAEDWETAYELRCAADREAETLEEFTARVSEPRIVSYDLGQVVLTRTPVELPATVEYADGTVRELTFPLEENTRTGRLEICGVVEGE